MADRERESVWRPSEEIWPAARDHEVEHGNDTGRRRSGDRIYTTTAISLDLCDPSTRGHTRRLLFARASISLLLLLVGRTTNHDSGLGHVTLRAITQSSCFEED